jgi:hypothetical protein
MNGAISLLPPHAFMAKTQNNFTFKVMGQRQWLLLPTTPHRSTAPLVLVIYPSTTMSSTCILSNHVFRSKLCLQSSSFAYVLEVLPCSFLGAFAKLRIATTSFMSVRPSVRMKQLGSHWTDFNKLRYVSVFRYSFKKIQVSLKSDKNNGYFT